MPGKEQKKGGITMSRLNLTGICSPCKPDCPRRSFDCHVRGNCEPYDAFSDACADIRERRRLGNDVNGAVADAVRRFGGRR